MAKTVSDKKALAKYLADYIDHERERKPIWLWNLQDIIDWLHAGLEAYESINDTTPIKITTIEQLKGLAKEYQGLDCYILLNGGLKSSKHIRFFPDSNSFYVHNLIDSSEQELTEAEITDSGLTNIGEAMKRGALIARRTATARR